MLTLMPVVLDIASLVILLFSLIRGWKKGFVRMLLLFFGTVVLLILAYIIGQSLSAILVSQYHDQLVSATGTQLENTLGTGTVEAIGGLLAILPSSLQESLFGSSVDFSTESVAEAIADSTVIPILKWLLSCLIFLMIFLIGKMILHHILKKKEQEEKTAAGFINSGAGAIIGFFHGCILLLLLTCAVSLLLSVSGGNLEWLNESVISKSTLFRLFYELNPLILSNS